MYQFILGEKEMIKLYTIIFIGVCIAFLLQSITYFIRTLINYKERRKENDNSRINRTDKNI